jgi:DNA-binding transcriptional LysR family regulator
VRSILSDVDAAEEAAHSDAREMSGSVRVLSLPGMPTHLVAPVIAEFRRQHPKVTVQLRSDALASRDIAGHDITLLIGPGCLPATQWSVASSTATPSCVHRPTTSVATERLERHRTCASMHSFASFRPVSRPALSGWSTRPTDVARKRST